MTHNVLKRGEEVKKILVVNASLHYLKVVMDFHYGLSKGVAKFSLKLDIIIQEK